MDMETRIGNLLELSIDRVRKKQHRVTYIFCAQEFRHSKITQLVLKIH